MTKKEGNKLQSSFLIIYINKGVSAGDIEQHLYTLRGIGFPVSKFASEGYVIFHKRFQY